MDLGHVKDQVHILVDRRLVIYAHPGYQRIIAGLEMEIRFRTYRLYDLARRLYRILLRGCGYEKFVIDIFRPYPEYHFLIEVRHDVIHHLVYDLNLEIRLAEEEFAF